MGCLVEHLSQKHQNEWWSLCFTTSKQASKTKYVDCRVGGESFANVSLWSITWCITQKMGSPDAAPDFIRPQVPGKRMVFNRSLFSESTWVKFMGVSLSSASTGTYTSENVFENG